MMKGNLPALFSLAWAFIILSFEGGCQNIDTGRVLYHNKIDDIKTSKEVKELLITMDTDFKRFEVNDRLKFSDPDCAKLVKTLSLKPFVKADFDGNGWTDLLVIGRYYDHMIICIMDSGQNHFFYRILTKRSFQDCTFPVVVENNNKYFIDYYGYKEPDWITKDTAHTIVKKRLVYQFADFVECNGNVQDHKIEKIEYSTTMCFGTCPVFSLTINKDGTAEYDAKQYNDELGKFTTTIDERHLNELIRLVNYIDFPKLKDHYSVNWTDDQTCSLVIAYDGGKQKKIVDYGLIGTFGLNRLYNFLFDLRKNQTWNK